MNSEKQTILIVDDVYFSAKYMEDILKEEYQVVVVTSGKACMDYVKCQNVDLILLDVVMPEMDGYEVCRKLKADPTTKKIPVIFLSAKGNTQDEARGLELGAIDYITKPACASIIKARIKNHLAIKMQNDLLEKLSFIDALTSVFNRRYLDDALAKEWRCALRSGELLSLLLVDIDFFKAFNDYYGHLEGDRCLQKVASVLKRSVLRPGDVVARYGGEEFILILPSTSKEGATKVATRIQENLAFIKMEHRMSKVSKYVTVSIGIATTIAKEVFNEKSMIRMADLALYQAKSEGRNRFV